MFKYLIKNINTDLLDCSTLGERDYVAGDSEIVLHKWATNPSVKYFEKSEASIMLSGLPQELQKKLWEVEHEIIEYVKSL